MRLILQQQQALALVLLEEEEEQLQQNKKRQRGTSTRQSHKRMRRDPNGELVEFLARDTPWYFMYISDPDVGSSKFQKDFRNRFRMSYSTFLSHLDDVSNDVAFRRWSTGSTNAVGQASAPIGLLLLGTLRYLGRAWTFDDLEEATTISPEVHRCFLHVYLDWCSTTLFDKVVKYPSLEEAKKIERIYAMAGFPGCVGSGDGTHVPMHRCPFRLRELNKSFKLSCPARTYNVFVSHDRNAMSSTRGHPARWNDKSLINVDDFATLLMNGTLFVDDDDAFYFQLQEKNEDGSIKSVWYRGCYTIVDNGYVERSTLVPPSKCYMTYDDMRWSKWLESMRKDVECFFGEITVGHVAFSICVHHLSFRFIS